MPRVGDDEAVQEPDQRPDADHGKDRDRDRQAGMDDEAGDQHAFHARGEADRQVELADDDGDGEAAGDDHGERRLVEDVDAVGERREGDRRDDREGRDHQGEADDGAVAGEEAERRLGARHGGGRRDDRPVFDLAHCITVVFCGPASSA
jgi:hypothetical protein